SLDWSALLPLPFDEPPHAIPTPPFVFCFCGPGLDRAAWGRGYAFEAAHAVTRFALEDVGLTLLKAGHADDNPASGRILTKLGFTPLDTVQIFSRPRGENIARRRYTLTYFSA
ncbi:MAG: GNAT family N-acetyltransferase, partial [Hyphomicrobiaceae bacterium]